MAAYHDQVDRLEWGDVETIGKHFTYLYEPARERAFTSRNFLARWAKAGLFPFNPERVLHNIPSPNAETAALKRGMVDAHFVTPGRVPQPPPPPTTLVSAEAITLLHVLVREDTHVLDETHEQRLQRRIRVLTNATQQSITERALFQEENGLFVRVDDEAKVHQATKSKVIYTARVVAMKSSSKQEQNVV